MAIYTAQVSWQHNPEENYLQSKYSRAHQWHFDGGTTVNASSSPTIVPLPYSVAEHVDPEEAFIASISSCHMLFFLSLAAKAGYAVESYQDNAQGIMSANDTGKIAMTMVTLSPKMEFSGEKLPSQLAIEELHHKAHQQCFIANSVNCEIVIDLS